MIHPSYTELIEAINEKRKSEDADQVLNSRYSLVLATSKRARQLIAGAEPLVENTKKKKPLSIAIDELYKGKVQILAPSRSEEEEGEASQALGGEAAKSLPEGDYIQTSDEEDFSEESFAQENASEEEISEENYAEDDLYGDGSSEEGLEDQDEDGYQEDEDEDGYQEDEDEDGYQEDEDEDGYPEDEDEDGYRDDEDEDDLDEDEYRDEDGYGDS